MLTLALLGMAAAGQAQGIIANDFDAPDAFITILNSPDDSQTPPIGNCAIFFPADQGSAFGHCQVTGATPDTIFIWEGPPVDGDTPALTLPYGDGTIQIDNPSANFYNELDNGNVSIQVGRLGTIVGQGQVRRPSRPSFSRANLNGDQQVPPNSTMATGTCDVLLAADDFIAQAPFSMTARTTFQTPPSGTSGTGHQVVASCSTSAISSVKSASRAFSASTRTSSTISSTATSTP